MDICEINFDVCKWTRSRSVGSSDSFFFFGGRGALSRVLRRHIWGMDGNFQKKYQTHIWTLYWIWFLEFGSKQGFQEDWKVLRNEWQIVQLLRLPDNYYMKIVWHLPEKLSMKLSLKMSPINHPEIIFKHFPDIVSEIVPKIVP